MASRSPGLCGWRHAACSQQSLSLPSPCPSCCLLNASRPAASAAVAGRRTKKYLRRGEAPAVLGRSLIGAWSRAALLKPRTGFRAKQPAAGGQITAYKSRTRRPHHALVTAAQRGPADAGAQRRPAAWGRRSRCSRAPLPRPL